MCLDYLISVPYLEYIASSLSFISEAVYPVYSGTPDTSTIQLARLFVRLN